MSHLPLWYLNQLDEQVCEKIIEELASTQTKNAVMGIAGDEINFETRKTKVSFANPDYWLSNIFNQFAAEANKLCGWEYHITNCENIQFAEYSESHHYTWHTDTFTLSGKLEDRKITIVALLNDEFQGGDFEIRLYKDYKVPLKKGSMLAFPSILEHRVTPITQGTRYSATMWLNGPRFR